MEKEIVPELLEKYLRGDCTDEEILQVHAWYDSFEDDEDMLSYLPAIEKEQLKQVLLERIKSDIDTEVAENGTGKLKSLRFPKATIFYLVSVIAAIFIMAFGVLIYIQNKSLSNKTPQWVHEIVVNNITQAYVKQKLPDGSNVWLSPGAVMTYPRTFNKEKREIKMVGEAFFEVTKNPTRPFVIYSGALATRVWGTSFKVNASQNNPINRVAVLTGKVSVTIPPSYAESLESFFGMDDHINQVMLLPYQEATYLTSVKTLNKTSITNKSVILCWKRENVSFNNEPMKKVIEVLNEKFDVHIVAADKNIEKYHIKADFSDQNLADVLEIMHLSMNIAYTIDHDQIQLKTIQPN
jgi:transmembrane sensor